MVFIEMVVSGYRWSLKAGFTVPLTLEITTLKGVLIDGVASERFNSLPHIVGGHISGGQIR